MPEEHKPLFPDHPHFPGRFDGKVAFVTGAARGQGRSHAIRLAKEGATLALLDICRDVDGVVSPGATSEDLVETVRTCEGHGAKVISAEVDVRDYEGVCAFADRTRSEFGRIDVLLVTHGIYTSGYLGEIEPSLWNEMIDINLTGVWHVCRAIVPSMEAQEYGRVVITASAGAVITMPTAGAYCAAKHGVAGMAKTLALEVAKKNVTVNVVAPTSVRTPMIENQAHYESFGAHDADSAREAMAAFMPTGLPWIEPEDATAMNLYLASDEARFVTGAIFLIDMGVTAG